MCQPKALGGRRYPASASVRATRLRRVSRQLRAVSESLSTAQEQRVSALTTRIAAGKAEPISAEEREIVASLRAGFEKKYGRRNSVVRMTVKKVGGKY